MSVQIIAAIIAVTGVVISVVVSYLTSSKNVDIELKKHKEILFQEFGQKLFEKRLEVYPTLYALVSNFIKTVRFGNLSNKEIKKLSNNLLEWDTNHAIYMSAETQYLFHKFKLAIAELSYKDDKELSEEFREPESKKKIKEEGEKIEIALKNELGIYAFESPNKVVPEREFKSYKEADEYIKNNK